MNSRQRRFVDEYLIDLNATQAAIRAGYSARTAYSAGQRALKDVEISAAIETARTERAKRTQVTQDYVLSNLMEVVERCMQRAPVMVRRGKEVVQAKDADDNHIWQFDARGANGALTLLGKHLGMYTDRQEVTGLDGAPLSIAITHEVVDPSAN